MNSLSRSFSVERKVRPILVVFSLPAFELASEILPAAEGSPFVEFFGVGLMAPFDLPVDLWASWWDMVMRDAKIREVPGELRSKGRVVVCLNSVDRKGEMLSDLLQELHRGLRVVVIVDAENPKSRRFVNRCELIEALTRTTHTRNEFHIELHGTAWNRMGSVGRLGARAILLQRDSANVMPMKDFQDGCR
jgi:hypothetical protein